MDELPQTVLDYAPWKNSTSSIWMLSQLTLRRNVSQYPFPHRLTNQERSLIRDIIKSTLEKTLTSAPHYLPLHQLTPIAKTFLAEQLFWDEDIYQLFDETALYMPESLEWQAVINGRDHLSIQRLAPDENLSAMLQPIFDLEQTLSQHLHFAFEQEFGYLTSEIAHCGHALSAQTFLHIPALSATPGLDDFLLNALPEGISARKLYSCEILSIFNTHCMGSSTQELLTKLTQATKTLKEKESSLQTDMQNRPTSAWLNRITRAYGLLGHSYKLTTREAMGHLSLIKLGVNLGWIQGISDLECNDLFFKIRRSHLNAPSQEEANTQRAHLLKKALAPCVLTI